METTALRKSLVQLEALRGSSVLIYHNSIGDDSPSIVYEIARQSGFEKSEIDLLLTTSGGYVNVARKIALFLQHYWSGFNVLIPFQVRSAGTLLCLAAREIVMGGIAELGPIDMSIGAISKHPPDTPSMIGVEDIIAYREVAEDWFKVTSKEDRYKVFALLVQRIFPTDLGTFYRSKKLMLQIGNELIAYQLPMMDTKRRQQIVEQLVGGYPAHDYVITREEAHDLGLQIKFASQEEEEMMWNVHRCCFQYIEDAPTIMGIIMSKDWIALRKTRHDMPTSDSKEEPPGSHANLCGPYWEVKAVAE